MSMVCWWKGHNMAKIYSINIFTRVGTCERCGIVAYLGTISRSPVYVRVPSTVAIRVKLWARRFPGEWRFFTANPKGWFNKHVKGER